MAVEAFYAQMLVNQHLLLDLIGSICEHEDILSIVLIELQFNHMLGLVALLLVHPWREFRVSCSNQTIEVKLILGNCPAADLDEERVEKAGFKEAIVFT